MAQQQIRSTTTMVVRSFGSAGGTARLHGKSGYNVSLGRRLTIAHTPSTRFFDVGVTHLSSGSLTARWSQAICSRGQARYLYQFK